MAIYSLHHSFVGRVGSAAGTAGAHIRYITRPKAALAVISHGMGDKPDAWIDDAEFGLRSNARVIDKVRIALPIELTVAQNTTLMRLFAESISDARDGHHAPYVVAIHAPSAEGDQRNLHAHIVLHDRHPVTGKRVAHLSQLDGVSRLREAWEEHCNAALAACGHDARVDRRSHADRGIETAPGIHVGVQATAMARKGKRPQRVNPGYEALSGRTRIEENAARTRLKELAQEAAAKKLADAERQARLDTAAAIAAQEAARLEAAQNILAAENAQKAALEARLEARQAANRERRRQERLAAVQQPPAAVAAAPAPATAVPATPQPAEPAISVAVGIDPREGNTIRRQRWFAVLIDMIARTPDAQERQENGNKIMISWKEMKEPKEALPRPGELRGIQRWIQANVEIGKIWLAEMLDSGRGAKAKPVQVPSRGTTREASPKGRE